ncbi:MAG: thioredoxin [Stygiobacter sp.]|jgi:thioredoxin 1|uniref:Thioredoxin n=1 Tax=Stygiobacter electus TaxID=3032292 RepID=A0AAE3TCX9_9BACT|nr:thioredoxin [Stygiobacter electus]MDF1610907.1 thioredoxin [Stygiobacter electus]
MKPFTFTDSNFDTEALQSNIPVIVDFWAAWCGPCRMIAPIIEDLANEYDGRVKVGKLDVDENQQIAIRYGVRSIPTVLFFQNGQLKDQIIGAMPKTVFVDKLNKLLKN